MGIFDKDLIRFLFHSVLIKSAVKIRKWRENFMFEVLLLYPISCS